MGRYAMEVRDAAPGYGTDAQALEVPAGYKRTEIGVVPEDWYVKTLGDIGSFTKGRGIKRSDVAAEGLACVRYGEIYTRYNNSVHSPESRIPATVAQTSQRIENGDLLFAGSGETAEEIGKCVAYLGEAEAYAGGDIVILRPANQNSLYLGHLLNQGVVAEQKARYGQGDAVVHISARNLALVKLPLPPTRSEQDAIAEALSDVDGLLGALEALIAKKRAIKQAAMQQLLTGKTRLPGFSGAWETKQIDELATVDSENLSSATDPGFSFNYISLEQVDAGRLLGFTEEIFRTAPSRARRVLRHDDVLMSTVRPNLMAHLHFKSSLVPRAVCSTGFAVLRARPDKADAGFLFAHLFGYVVNNRIEKILAGSNYPAISSRDVRMIELPCPPTVAEQTAIATVLSDMDAEIAAFEARRDKTRALKQGMMQQLLTGRVRLVEPAPTPTAA